MTTLRGLHGFRRCRRSSRSAGLTRPRTEPPLSHVEWSPSFEGLGSRGQALSRWLFASPETVRWVCAAELPARSLVAAALPVRARKCQGEKYLPGSVLPPNQWLERTAQQLRCWVPSALRAAAAAQPQR